jgi:hypothetical protein
VELEGGHQEAEAPQTGEVEAHLTVVVEEVQEEIVIRVEVDTTVITRTIVSHHINKILSQHLFLVRILSPNLHLYNLDNKLNILLVLLLAYYSQIQLRNRRSHLATIVIFIRHFLIKVRCNSEIKVFNKINLNNRTILKSKWMIK